MCSYIQNISPPLFFFAKRRWDRRHCYNTFSSLAHTLGCNFVFEERKEQKGQSRAAGHKKAFKSVRKYPLSFLLKREGETEWLSVCFFPGKVSGGESKRIGVVAPFERKNAAENERERK